MCEHIIGILHNYEDTALFTFAELKEKSSENIRLSKIYPEFFENDKIYTMSDYCDKRKSTDLERFNFCPLCGEKIDWEEMRKNKNTI